MSDSPTRHEQRKHTTHQRLLDAARELIVQHGYGNVDILDITERADVSKATFYKHFPNKEECVRELMQHGFDALVAQIVRVKHSQPPAEWVRASFERAFDWAGQHRELMLIMVGGAASSQLNAFGRAYLVAVIEHNMTDDPVFEEEPRFPHAITAQIVTGIMIQLLGWWLENVTGYTALDMACLVHDTLRHGISRTE
jgi:AcrR family transcriptional regulator